MGEISHRDIRGIRVLDLSGDYMEIEDAATIESAIVEAMSTKPDGIVLNYGPVTRMTGGNYGVFFKTVVAAYKLAKNSELDVKILIPDNSQIYIFIEHLRITKLDKMVEVHTNESGVIDSFFPS